MQDSSLYSQTRAQFPEQEQLKCPRCDSTNTKFCYYNNYNLSQPRHFCKSCKRYWTKGGALRNIPVGGGSRKNAKRSSSYSAGSASSSSKLSAAVAASVSAAKDKKYSENINNSGEIDENLSLKGEDFGGQFENFSFGSLLGSSGDQYVGLLDGLSGPSLEMNGHFGNPGLGQDVNPSSEIGGGGNGDGFLNIHGGGGGGETNCWGVDVSSNDNEWPEPAIYTPGSTSQQHQGEKN